MNEELKSDKESVFAKRYKRLIEHYQQCRLFNAPSELRRESQYLLFDNVGKKHGHVFLERHPNIGRWRITQNGFFLDKEAHEGKFVFTSDMKGNTGDDVCFDDAEDAFIFWAENYENILITEIEKIDFFDD